MSRSPLIIGHRGASLHAPENTLAAFQMALDSGCDGVEFDVQLSRDGVPVVIHDFDLRRTGRRPDKIVDLHAKELNKIDVGSWFNAKFPFRSLPLFEDETIPRLSQVLDLLADSNGLIYIELKCERLTEVEPLARAVCDAIRDSPNLAKMIVKSFRLEAIPIVREHLPEVQTAALFSPRIANFMRSRKHILRIAQEFGATQISVHQALITRQLVSLAAEFGMPVTVWTADDPKWIERSRLFGIRSVITNDPAKLIKIRG
ncbi:MAG: glycerophosphodiester phosphodiesterase family protein [Pyrinomonadaceae bacterium]